jgi:hypothetical protein
MIKVPFFNSPTLWKDSFSLSFAILAILETILAVSSVSIVDLFGLAKMKWLFKLSLVLGLFILICFLTFLYKYCRSRKGISLKIRGIKVYIKKGDLFKAEGWKVIAFNEFYDTKVDDVIIAHNTVNGIFIDKYVDDISDLKNTIENADEGVTTYNKIEKNGRYIYPLGRIITYKDYMLLSFTHFINNEAHQSVKDYEESLRVMWKEICRTYANKPIFIPLLGAGITRFDDVPQKLKFNLLRCMLCTLRTSNMNINQPITILLTEDAIQDINLYELKGIR